MELILVKKDGISLIPDSPESYELFKKIEVGECVVAKIKRPISKQRQKLHGLFWKCAELVSENMTETFPTREKVLLYCKHELGYIKQSLCVFENGAVKAIVREYQTIKFNSDVPDNEVIDFLSAALSCMAGLLGVTDEELEEEAKSRMVKNV